MAAHQEVIAAFYQAATAGSKVLSRSCRQRRSESPGMPQLVALNARMHAQGTAFDAADKAYDQARAAAQGGGGAEAAQADAAAERARTALNGCKVALCGTMADVMAMTALEAAAAPKGRRR